MKAIKIGLIGSSGRMGLEIQSLLESSKNLKLFYCVSREIGKKKSPVHAKDLKSKEAESVELWIDFSSPELLMTSFKDLQRFKKPLVSGTTGLTPAHMKKLKELGKGAPVLWSSNMSLGVAALQKAMESFVDLKDYDFRIEEIHHKHKKDSPSGTAKTLRESLEKITGHSVAEPLSLRGGGVVGIHRVWALGEEETLCFEHTALHRRVFARGTLWAAQQLLQKKKGFYTFGDLLK